MSGPASALFPHFKPIELSDRDWMHEWIWKFQPQISELTFTNLFMWRIYDRLEWCAYKDWLILYFHPDNEVPYCLPPVGPSPRDEAVRTVLHWLREDRKIRSARIERADAGLISEIKNLDGISITPTRNHFDYLYSSSDLIQLAGRKFHNKKNHFNRFLKTHPFEYVPFTGNLAEECLRVLEIWCKQKECEKCPILKAETEAVKEALQYFDRLHIVGGAVLIDGKVEAFSLGEMLNHETAVIHVEKADPRIPELFTLINQQFSEHQWAGVPFINREQDLGLAGLRRAKESYNPVRFVEKYRIELHG